MIEALETIILCIAIIASWLALGAAGAAIQLWADKRMVAATSPKIGLAGFADRFYFAIFALTGPLAIAMAAGSALSALLFGKAERA